MIKSTFVEFFFGRYVSESEIGVQQVESREIKGLAIPKTAVAFRFYDKYSTVAKTEDGETVLLESDRVNISPYYYVGGTVISLEEVRENPHAERLIRNIVRSGFETVIRTRFGDIVPFVVGEDVVINEADLR